MRAELWPPKVRTWPVRVTTRDEERALARKFRRARRWLKRHAYEAMAERHVWAVRQRYRAGREQSPTSNVRSLARARAERCPA